MNIICKRLIKNLLHVKVLIVKNELHNIPKFYKFYLGCHKYKRKFSSVDTLDDFTLRLVDEKRKKWNEKKSIEIETKSIENETITYVEKYNCKNASKVTFKSKWKFIIESNQVFTNADLFSLDQINCLITSYFEERKWSDIQMIMNYCVAKKLSLSEDVMIKLFRFHSVAGNINAVKYLQNVCIATRSDYINKHSGFDYFLGIAHWKTGNIEKAFTIFEDSYSKNKSIERILFQVFKIFIEDVVKNNSEASNVTLRKLIERFVKKHNKQFIMFFLWESYWLSDWYRDQQMAEELLDQHDFLQTYLDKKCSIISVLALKNHYEDAVLRLLQILLKYNKMHEYCLVLRNLFDYRFKMNDFDGCSEIIKNCKSLKIFLTDSQQNKYFHRLHKDKIENIIEKPPSFTMKF